MSAREDVLNFIAGRLGAVAGVAVYRSRQAAVAREEGPCLILEPDEETPNKLGGAVVSRDLVVRVLLVLRSDTPDTTADPLLQSIHESFMGDLTLGGRAAACIEKSTRWNFELADITALVVEARYLIRYLTAVGSFATQG